MEGKGKPLGRFEVLPRVSLEAPELVPEGDSFPLVSTNCMTARDEAVSLLFLPCGIISLVSTGLEKNARSCTYQMHVERRSWWTRSPAHRSSHVISVGPGQSTVGPTRLV
jgi:hypothetical protein